MSYFKNYESETTLFLKELKKQKPNLEASQQAGRALLWDKAPLDLQERAAQQDARVPQQAYVYQTKG
jgi:hypothetical protein